jgi:Ca2+-binding EF-hand superfamily protein
MERRAALALVANIESFCDVRKLRLRDAFAIFDQDSSGSLSLPEMRHCFQNLGVPLSPDDLEAVMRHLDKDNSGSIELGEYEAAVRELRRTTTSAKRVVKKPAAAQIIGGHAYYCEWDPVLDPASGDFYYVNKYTDETSWDKPQELAVFERQIKAAKEIQKSARGRQGRVGVQKIRQERAKEVEHIVVKCVWEAVLDKASGDNYYYNTASKQTTWDKPAALIKWENQQKASIAVQSVQRGRRTREVVVKQKGSLKRQRQREAKTRLHTQYPANDHWEAIFDDKSGKTYYVNKATNNTSWDKPEEMERYEKHTEASTSIQSRARIRQARGARQSKYMLLLRKRIAQKCGGLEGLVKLFEALTEGGDLEVDGVISKDEFRTGIVKHLGIEVRADSDLNDLFVVLDIDKSGGLDFEELEQIVKFDLRADKAKETFVAKCVWEKMVDKATGDCYYCNSRTLETTWEAPVAFVEWERYKDAATRIQRMVRRRWARKEWRELIKAASVIGRHARRKVEGREREKKALERDRASVQVQKVARGRRARQTVAARRRQDYDIRRRQRLPGLKNGGSNQSSGVPSARGGVRPTPPNNPRAPKQHQRPTNQRNGNQREQQQHQQQQHQHQQQQKKLSESARQHHLDSIPAYAARLTTAEIQRLSREEIGQRIGLQPDRHSPQRIILLVGELVRAGAGAKAAAVANPGAAFGLGRAGPAGRRDSNNAKAIQRAINRSRRLSSLYQRGVARAARHTGAVVVDSGLTTGLAASSAMSDGHSANSVYGKDNNSPEDVCLLGISAAVAPGSGPALHKYHTKQLVFTDVFQRGQTELRARLDLVEKLAGGCKVVVVVVNDGPSIRDELSTLLELQQQHRPSDPWPVVALQGSGGFADTLAHICEGRARGEPDQGRTEDELIAGRLIGSDAVFVFPADGTPSELASFLHVLLTVSVR